ncbi:MAG: hypothetical protein HY901_37255 [Deltaproteobacteria bacterium]|nr:hypothetical protein [Deltaproteobacteria bacterium]
MFEALGCDKELRPISEVDGLTGYDMVVRMPRTCVGQRSWRRRRSTWRPLS